MARRLGIDLTVPDAAVAMPTPVQREGQRSRTGILLATWGAEIARVASEAVQAPLLNLERRLAAADHLAARIPDRALSMNLTGSMAAYAWGTDGRSYGDRSPTHVAPDVFARSPLTGGRSGPRHKSRRDARYGCGPPPWTASPSHSTPTIPADGHLLSQPVFHASRDDDQRLVCVPVLLRD